MFDPSNSYRSKSSALAEAMRKIADAAPIDDSANISTEFVNEHYRKLNARQVIEKVLEVHLAPSTEWSVPDDGIFKYTSISFDSLYINCYFPAAESILDNHILEIKDRSKRVLLAQWDGQENEHKDIYLFVPGRWLDQI